MSSRAKKSPTKRKSAKSENSSQNSGPKTSSTPTSETSSLPAASEPETRDPATGQFLPGQSGNPKGKSLSTRNRLTTVKQEMELAIRQDMSPAKLSQIVNKMYELALEGSVGAAKLLLDKTVSNAKTEEDDGEGPKGVRIVIENMTVNPAETPVEMTVIEHPPQEESP